METRVRKVGKNPQELNFDKISIQIPSSTDQTMSKGKKSAKAPLEKVMPEVQQDPEAVQPVEYEEKGAFVNPYSEYSEKDNRDLMAFLIDNLTKEMKLDERLETINEGIKSYFYMDKKVAFMERKDSDSLYWVPNSGTISFLEYFLLNVNTFRESGQKTFLLYSVLNSHPYFRCFGLAECIEVFAGGAIRYFPRTRKLTLAYSASVVVVLRGRIKVDSWQIKNLDDSLYSVSSGG